MRRLAHRADAVHRVVTAEADAWRETWRAFYLRRTELADAEARREWFATQRALEAMDDGTREAWVREVEAARVAFVEGDRAAHPPCEARLGAWRAWWAEMEAALGRPGIRSEGLPQLDFLPHSLPPPPAPDATEAAERARMLAAFRAAGPGSARRVAVGYLVFALGLVDAVREVHSG